jgi:hypothetical protein
LTKLQNWTIAESSPVLLRSQHQNTAPLVLMPTSPIRAPRPGRPGPGMPNPRSAASGVAALRQRTARCVTVRARGPCPEGRSSERVLHGLRMGKNVCARSRWICMNFNFNATRTRCFSFQCDARAFGFSKIQCDARALGLTRRAHERTLDFEKGRCRRPSRRRVACCKDSVTGPETAYHAGRREGLWSGAAVGACGACSADTKWVWPQRLGWASLSHSLRGWFLGPHRLLRGWVSGSRGAGGWISGSQGLRAQGWVSGSQGLRAQGWVSGSQRLGNRRLLDAESQILMAGHRLGAETAIRR